MTTARAIARITGSPWLIQAEALETIIQIAGRDTPDEAAIGQWKRGHQREALAVRGGDPLGNAPSARVRDGVAIVPIAGPIFRYANLFTDMSGATALADVASNIAAAVSDSRVRAILLEVDSPGGEAIGLSQAADQIAAAARVKPVVAYVEGSAMSAAYWLASAASEIVMDPIAAVGSLGAVIGMQDRTEAEAKAGTRRYRFVSSQTPNKLLDPTTDAGANRIQALADRVASEFLASAAANRGMSVEALLAATDGGGLLVGADAVTAGLADSVAGFEETLARLASGTVKTRGAAAPVVRASAAEPSAQHPGPALRATSQEPRMDPMHDAPAQPEMTTQQTEAPATAPQAEALPVQTSAGLNAEVNLVAAERARCAAINGAAKPGQQALAALAIEEGWTVETFNRAQAANETAVAQARTEAAGAGFRDSLPAPLAGGGGGEAELSGEAKWKNEFATDVKLRAEFRTEGAYVAYRQAEAAGKVRALKRA